MEDTPHADARQTRRTGNWVLLVDGISLGVLGLGVGVAGAAVAPGTDRDVGLLILVAGGVGSRLAAPIVHWVHGHAVRGFVSLVLRIFVPTLVGLAAAGGDITQSDRFLIGNLVGLAGVIALEAYVQARHSGGQAAAGERRQVRVRVSHDSEESGLRFHGVPQEVT
jgi:hypothetical protein